MSPDMDALIQTFQDTRLSKVKSATAYFKQNEV